MNREIKFRAWDKYYKRFRDIVLTNPISALNDNKIDERFEFTQYIGLKDIKGNQIYEGDIVQYTDNYNTDIPQQTGIVKFDNASFYITDGAYSCYRWIDINVEVIGNIFEDKDLVDKYELEV